MSRIKHMRQLLFWIEGFANKMTDIMEDNDTTPARSDCCGDKVWSESLWSEAMHVNKKGEMLDYGEFEFDWIDYSEQYRCSGCGEECSFE